jgi:hypothetical protein
MNKRGFIIARVIALVGFLVLLGLIIYGVVAKDIIAEGNIMLAVFWGQFTFVDIYIAFIVFFIWIVIREKSLWKSIVWFLLIMAGGSMSICLYLYIALSTCNYDLGTLMMGKRSKIYVG